MAATAALAPEAEAEAGTIDAARTLIPLGQPETLVPRVRRFWDRLA